MRPWVLLAVLLSRGAAFRSGVDLDSIYGDAYYNEISDSEPENAETSASPCQAVEQSRWDKLFIALEDSQMRQNMLLEQLDDLIKVELQPLKVDMQKHLASSGKECVQALQSTCQGLGDQAAQQLDRAVSQLQQAGEKALAQQNATLTQLLDVSRSQAVRLAQLETSCLSVVGLGPIPITEMKGYPTNLKQQGVSSADGGKFEKILVSLATDLQKVQAQLSLSQRLAAQHFLPSGCEMGLLFPMRSCNTVAKVTTDISMALDAVTVCLWTRVTESLNRTVLFSYGTQWSPQELQLLVSGRDLLFTVGGEDHLVEARGVVNEGQWRHFCGAWSSKQGLATLYVDGQQMASSFGSLKSHSLPAGGALLVGQELSSLGSDRDFNPATAFTGKMTGLNLWDHLVEAERISQLAQQEGSLCGSRGNVIGWGVSEIVPRGGAQYIR